MTQTKIERLAASRPNQRLALQLLHNKHQAWEPTMLDFIKHAGGLKDYRQEGKRSDDFYFTDLLFDSEVLQILYKLTPGVPIQQQTKNIKGEVIINKSIVHAEKGALHIGYLFLGKDDKELALAGEVSFDNADLGGKVLHYLKSEIQQNQEFLSQWIL